MGAGPLVGILLSPPYQNPQSLIQSRFAGNRSRRREVVPAPVPTADTEISWRNTPQNERHLSREIDG